MKSRLNWIEVFAGLNNDGMRKVLGLVLNGDFDSSTADKSSIKNLQRWSKIGLIAEVEGVWRTNDAAIKDVLSSNRKPVESREGIQRFFNGPELVIMPARPEERLAVLTKVRDSVIRASEQLSEAQLNDRLRVIHDDVAMMRRYMVDHGLVERSLTGSCYSRP